MKSNAFLIFVAYIIIALIAVFIFEWLVVQVFHQPLLVRTEVYILMYFFIYALFAVIFPDFTIMLATFTAVIWQYISWAFCQLGWKRFCVTPQRRMIDILVSMLGFIVGVGLRYLPDVQIWIS